MDAEWGERAYNQPVATSSSALHDIADQRFASDLKLALAAMRENE
jgi:hypothetical protein